MKKVLTLFFIGVLFLGCGKEGACCSSNIKNTTAQPNLAEKNIEAPFIAKIELKKKNSFHAEYDLIFCCKCNNKEYDGGKLIVDTVAGTASATVDYNLTTKMIEIQNQHPNQIREYRVVNSGSIYLDSLHTLDEIEKNLNIWIKELID